MSTQSNLHNELAPKILKEIVKRVTKTGGTPRDMMVIVESVAAGIVIFGAIPGMHGQAIDELTTGIKRRVSEMLLNDERPPEEMA